MKNLEKIINSIFISSLLLLGSFGTSYAFVGNNNLLPSSAGTDGNEVDLYSGEAYHSINLQVPSGTNKLTPDLSLEYNSSTVESHSGTAFTNGTLFGAGWSIDFPYVYRDTNYTPGDTSDDFYRIDWQGASYKLVDQGSGKFKTNIETFTNITHATGSPNNASGDYWTVQTTDGTTYRFGYNASSEVACSNRSYPLEWVLDTVTDTHGNNIYYNYSQNPYTNDIGAIYPTSIKYNNDQNREIDFTFSSSDSSTMTQEYFEGCLIRYARNLTSVTTKANGSQVKKYNLSYTNTLTHNLLNSVTELGSDNTAKPATSFSYNSEAAGFATSNTGLGNLSIDFNANGGGNVVLADMNGDGLTDLVMADSNGYHVYLNNGSTFSNPSTNWGNPGFVFTTNSDVRLADMNGDGLPDLIKADSSGYHVYLNTGSGFNSTSQLWGNPGFDFTANSDDVALVDMNGDGLPDLVKMDSSGYHVYLNSGSSFSSTSTSWGNPGIDLNWNNKNVRLADMNGDGLTDIIFADSNGYYVYLNTGSGFTSSWQGWGSITNDFNWNNGDVRLADMNGDGLPDLVFADSNGYYVYFNTGNSFHTPSTTWSNFGDDFNWNNGNVRLADINGDGLTDLVFADSNGFYMYPETTGSPYLLSSISTDKGATISYNYVKSTGTSGTKLPFNEWLVSQMTIDNGMTNSQHTSDTTMYTYKNGTFNWPNKEFRGFGEVDETDPNGAKKQTYFKQDDGLKGTMYDQKTNDGSGNPYTETLDTWNSASSSGVFTNTLTSEKQYTYDGTSSNPKVEETDYAYDSYGNVTKESDLGDTNVSGDERYIYKQYTYNTSSYIVNLPYDTYTNKSDDSTKVSETWDYYDNNTNLTDAPTKGDLTKEVKWLSGGTNPTTTYTYDSYGNKTQETDANNHSTSYTYDTTGTYQTSMTNAKSQTSYTSYDLGTGNLLSKTDPNGFITTYSYDPFGRVAQELDPDPTASGNSDLTKTYTYYDNSTAPQGVLQSQVTVSSTSGLLNFYTFVDGLGRKIQTRKPAEDTSKQIVTDTFYASNGKVAKESVPHLDTLGTTYASPVTGIEDTIYTYDPIARVTQITNPQGTSKTTSYDHWSQTDTDENGHTKKKVMDAYNNIVEVDEHNNGSTYTTTYTYDSLNNLTKITDANSNQFTFTYDTLGRKVTEVDPDMGTWSYTYDGVDNLLTKTDNRGITTTNTYDELNRKASVSYPTDTGITYSYDGNGRIGTLTSVTDAMGTESYQYDKRLRKTQDQRVTDGITWTKNYTYDAANRILTTTMPDSQVLSNTYDAQGEVASVSGVVNNVDYNALNKVTDKTFNNGQTTNYTYNTNDFRLNRIQTGTAQDISYTYDNVGNVKTTTDNLLSKTQTFGYDGLDRLTTASESAGYNYTYAYDPIGNMTSFSSPDTTTTYTYGSSTLVHAPATATSTTMIYDDALANGWTDASFNTTNSVQTTNVYTGSNALSSTINANGGLDFQAPRFFNSGGYDYIHFALKASATGQQYKVYADSIFGQAFTTPVSLANYGGQPTTSGWTVYNIPLADLAAANVNLSDIVIQNATGSNEPAVYVDQVELMSGVAPTPIPTATPTPAPSTIQQDGTVQSTYSGGGNVTLSNFSVTGSNSNRFLLVAVGSHQGGGSTGATGVTYGGTAMTLLKSMIGQYGEFVQLWGLEAPAGGTGNIVTSGLSGGDFTFVSAYSLYNVKQTYTVQTAALSQSSGSSSVSITPNSANNWIIDAIEAEPVPSVSGSNTQDWSQDGAPNSYDNGNGSRIEQSGGPTSVSMAWNLSYGGRSNQVAVGLEPASTGPTPTPTPIPTATPTPTPGPTATPTPTPSSSGIALDGSIHSTYSGGGNVTLSSFPVTGSNSNRFLLVAVGSHQGGGSTGATGVTYGGTAMTLLKSKVGSYGEFVQLWGLEAPAGGTGNIVTSGLSGGDFTFISAYSLYNVKQTYTVVTGSKTQSSSSSSISVTPNSANNWIIDAIEAEPVPSVSGSNTQDWSQDGAPNSYDNGNGSIIEQSGGPTAVSMAWSLSYGGRSNQVVVVLEHN